jgi:hypothetical protein
MGQCPFSGYFSVTFTTLRLLLNYFSFFSLALTTPQSQTPGHHRNLQGWGFNAVVEGLPSMFNALDWIHSTPLNTHTHTHTHTHTVKKEICSGWYDVHSAERPDGDHRSPKLLSLSIIQLSLAKKNSLLSCSYLPQRHFTQNHLCFCPFLKMISSTVLNPPQSLELS